MRVLGQILGWGLLLAMGCRGSTPAVDPFGWSGPSRIPPPPTGTAGRTDPYYQRPMAMAPGTPSAQVSSLPNPPMATYSSDKPGVSSNSSGAAPPLNGGAQLDWRAPGQDPYATPAGYQARPQFSSPATPAGFTTYPPSGASGSTMTGGAPTTGSSSGGWQSSNP